MRASDLSVYSICCLRNTKVQLHHTSILTQHRSSCDLTCYDFTSIPSSLTVCQVCMSEAACELIISFLPLPAHIPNRPCFVITIKLLILAASISSVLAQGCLGGRTSS